MGVKDVIVALDGGGSKTDAVALTPDGEVLARARAGASSPQTVGVDSAVDVVDGLVRSVLAESGAEVPARVHAYLSGLDLPGDAAAFRAALGSVAWLPRDPYALVVENDMLALLRAGTDEPDAVAVVCGTGINAIGVRHDGRTVRFPALGTITGDWGGGWELGAQAIWHAARAIDGRGPTTALVDLIPPVLGLRTVEEVIHALHDGDVLSAQLSRLCPAVLQAADAGDAAAIELVDRQAEEVVAMAATALRRLGLLGRAVPVVLGGGVIASGHSRLMRGIRDGIARRSATARIELVLAPPVVGAALLAVASSGGRDDALVRVRHELSPVHQHQT